MKNNSRNRQNLNIGEKLVSAKNINEYWKCSKNILRSRPSWDSVENIKKGGAKKFAEQIASAFKKTDISDYADKKEIEGFFLVGKLMEKSIKENNNKVFANHLLLIILNHLEDLYGLEKGLSDSKITKEIVPNLSKEMCAPFTVFFCLIAGNVQAELNDLKKEEQEKFYALSLGIWQDIEYMISIESMLGIKNSDRKKQIEKLRDDNHEKATDAYYDIIEKEPNKQRIKKKMRELIKEDPDFFDPYLDIVDILYEEEKYGEGDKLLEEGFKRAMERIVDKEGMWPKSMCWGYMENRHLIRIIDRFAYELWSKGRVLYALSIYKKLLRSNPNDNVGARYNILAIMMGYAAGEIEEEFASDTFGYVDAMKMGDWFYKNAGDFPEELGWWLNED